MCKSWRDALLGAPQLWATVTVDPRRRISSPTRIRFRKHLPSADALAAWARSYAAHVTSLSLANLGEQSAGAGCVDKDQLEGFAEQVKPAAGWKRWLRAHSTHYHHPRVPRPPCPQLAPRLEALAVSNCESAYVQAALHAQCDAPRLRSLRLQLQPAQRAIDWLGTWLEVRAQAALAGRQRSPAGKRQRSPAGPAVTIRLRHCLLQELSGLEGLRELSLVWAPPALGEVLRSDFLFLDWGTRLAALRTLTIQSAPRHTIALPPALGGALTALRELRLEGKLGVVRDDRWQCWHEMTPEHFAATVCSLTGLTRLSLARVGVGRVGAGWEDPEGINQPSFRLPEEISQLQALRALSIREHWLKGARAPGGRSAAAHAPPPLPALDHIEIGPQRSCQRALSPRRLPPPLPFPQARRWSSSPG